MKKNELSVKEAAKVLGISQNKLNEICKEGNLPIKHVTEYFQSGVYNKYVFTKENIKNMRKWLSEKPEKRRIRPNREFEEYSICRMRDLGKDRFISEY